MIDTKRYEELVSKRAELNADFKVCRRVFDFARVNADLCRLKRNVIETQSWIDVMKAANAKLETISAEYDKLIKAIDEL